jgi:hypothetical protein
LEQRIFAVSSDQSLLHPAETYRQRAEGAERAFENASDPEAKRFAQAAGNVGVHWRSLPSVTRRNGLRSPPTEKNRLNWRLQHQIRAAHAAPIIHPVCGSSRAVGGNLCQQIDHLAVAPALLDQSCDPVLTGAGTRGAFDPKSAELALQVSEYDGAVAGHGAMIA